MLCAILITSFAALPIHAINRKYHSVLTEQEKAYIEQTSGTFTKFLGWCHEQRNKLVNFVEPHQESFLTKITSVVKLPFRIGSAILNPLKFIKKNVIVPILSQGISYPSRYVTGKVINKIKSKFNPEEELTALPPQIRSKMKAAEHKLAYATSRATVWLADGYINKALNKITYKFLRNVIPSMQLPDPSEYPKKNCNGETVTYQDIIESKKDLIVNHIFSRFEDKLPESLQNGKAFEYYQAGKTVCGHAMLIYHLVDNITAALSIGYQLTDHYEKLTQRSHSFVFAMPITRLKKTIMVFDIIRRCADSYVKVINHFNLGANASRGMKIFNKGLSYFTTFANAVCPRRDYIVGAWETGKMLYALYKMNKKLKIHSNQTHPNIEETIKTLGQTKYKMSNQDAHMLEAVLIKINHSATENEREKNIMEAEKMLAKYNTNLATFTFELYMKNPAIAQLKNIFIEKYKIPESETRKLILAMLNNNQQGASKILRQYNISEQQLINDPSIRKIQVAW
jgi:hypothetical protein